MIDTVIFDLDGTLLNTLEDLTDATNTALIQHGYPQRTLPEIRQFVGSGVYLLIQRAVPKGTPELDVQMCLSAFKAAYKENWKDKTQPYEGVVPLLADLRQRGIKIAVISNKYDKAVLELCRDYFPGSFGVVRGEREGIPKKPAPDGIYAILKELGSKKAETVYVGDSEVDMATAQNAGLTSVGVTWGFRDRALLQERGADYIIDEPKQLLDIIT